MTQASSGKDTLYSRIYVKLKERIEAGEWSYGALLPTEADLCAAYGVSRGTIRLVLSELEQEGMVRRERGRGTMLTYTAPERPAAQQGYRSISFIVPYVRDSFVSSILLGLEREARAQGYATMFNHVENQLERQDQALRTAVQQGAAGIVLYPVDSGAACPALIELAQQAYPLVLVDRYMRGLYTDYVTSDNFGGGLCATQHLLALGHRRIAFLAWCEMATTMEHRRAGYRQALFETGMQPDPNLEWEVGGYPEVDQAALEGRLRSPGRPTAIFAANDQLALAVQRAARALKIATPQELALVGFDDLDISANLDIPLTTVAQAASEIGRTAAELLLERISGRADCLRRRILPVRLVIRQSCGATLREGVKGGR